jgi:hypothetical protein
MLTNAMPAVMRALQGSLPPNALKQLTQALGNCNQQLTHRGDISVRPDAWSYVNNNNGAYGGYPPSSNEYNQYVNNNEYNEYTDINNQNYNTYNTNIDYGDTIIVQGGPPGDPGRDGREGRDGTDGAAGAAGQAGAAGEAGPPGSPGAAGGNGRDGRDGAAGRDGAPGSPGAAGRDGRDATVDIEQLVTILLGRLRLQTAEVVTDVEEFYGDQRFLTSATFSESACDIDTDDAESDAIVGILPRTKTIRFYGP